MFIVSVFILLHEIVCSFHTKLSLGSRFSFAGLLCVIQFCIFRNADFLPIRSVTCYFICLLSPIGLKFYAHRTDHSKRGKQKEHFGWLH